MLNLVFLLDITGSMSNELDGVKDTVARLVDTVFVDHKKELVVTIITFTEDDRGCYVTRHSFDDGVEASSFVSRIKLCVPPGMANVQAGGGDGPENHKAALAEMMMMDGSVPTVAFVITDALPHLIGVESRESNHEKTYLQSTYGITNRDLFAILDQLDAHFQGNLVLSVLKYYQSQDHSLYGAVAKRFNGVLVTPQVRSAPQLAIGLMAILTPMFRSVSGGAPLDDNAIDHSALQAFRFFDLEAIEIPSSEQGRGAIAMPTVGATDELLFKLVERTTVIAGGKFKKRAITAHLLTDQVELLLVLAKGVLHEIPRDEAIQRATCLLTKIKSLMGEEHTKQFKLEIAELERVLASDAVATGTSEDDSHALSAAVSAITLMSIEETARDLSLDDGATDGDDDVPEPKDPYAALLDVASLFLGHLAVLELPTRMGVVDFMDAWSATITKVSNDVVTAADFLTMIGDKTGVDGLSMRDREYNFLQLVADPHDAVGSELLRLASGTQVLDILTALLSGAPPGLFSPNMFRGTISACLMSLLSVADADLTEFQWSIALKMVHTVRLLMGARATSLTLEPESAMGKLLFRLLRLTDPSEVATTGEIDERELRAFLEEMAAARAQKFAKYNEKKYLELVEAVVGYEHSSVLEDVFDTHVLLDGSALAIASASHAADIVSKSEFCTRVERSANNVLRAVFAGRKVPSLTQVWPSYLADLPKLLLLQKRTERYTLVESGGEKQWVRDASVMATSLEDSPLFAQRALAMMRDKYAAFVRDTRAQRADMAAQERWRRVVKLMRAPLAEFVAQLTSVLVDSASREHKLMLKAFKELGSTLEQSDYEAKVTVVVTGRSLEGQRDIVFNRGNLHPHPDRFVPMTDAFKASLRTMQRTLKWSTAHRYRESGVPNHSGFSNDNPSPWAAKRSLVTTFWEMEE